MIERMLNMKFNDLAGGKFTFAVKDIKSDVKDEDVSVAMTSIIASDVFLTKGGKLISKEDAQIVTKETTEVVL
ncbi:MAG: DUF2922 domain-containing protein [Clostridium sp.]